MERHLDGKTFINSRSRKVILTFIRCQIILTIGETTHIRLPSRTIMLGLSSQANVSTLMDIVLEELMATVMLGTIQSKPSRNQEGLCHLSSGT